MITSMNGCQVELYRLSDQQRLGGNDSPPPLEGGGFGAPPQPRALLGPACSQALPHFSQRTPGRRPIRLSEDGAQGSRHDRLVAAGHVGQQVSHTCACTAGASVKCTRQRCQLTLARTWSKAAFRPSWASLVTSCTPFKPRRTKLRRKSTQKAPSSLAPR